ncbi:MAG: restriction endonuclease subunit S [Chloroflexota bacterium]|nr:restriction endonuclease subunit S [Chloroflexota bacterium]
MNRQWTSSTWGEIATLEYGRALRSYGDGSGHCRVFGTNGPIGWHNASITPNETVIVGRKGAYRGVHLSLDPCWVIDTAFYLVPKTAIDMRWAYYSLKMQDINSMDSGSAIPSTSRADFYSLPVDVPPMGEQRAIARVLVSLDDKIELNRQMNKTLEALAATIFRAWFVDFEPVRAKAAGQAPAGMDAATAALFPDRLVESELGDIPEGWCIAPLGNVLQFNYGKALKQSARRHGRVLVYGSAGQIGWHDEALVPNRGIIVGRKGNPGVVTLAPQPFFPIDTTFFVTPPFETIGYYYAYYMLVGLNLQALNNDSAVPGLSRNIAYLSEALLPPKNLVDLFEQLCEPVYARIFSNTEQIRTLEALRDTLLPGLLSGELRVPEELLSS